MPSSVAPPQPSLPSNTQFCATYWNEYASNEAEPGPDDGAVCIPCHKNSDCPPGRNCWPPGNSICFEATWDNPLFPRQIYCGDVQDNGMCAPQFHTLRRVDDYIHDAVVLDEVSESVPTELVNNSEGLREYRAKSLLGVSSYIVNAIEYAYLLAELT